MVNYEQRLFLQKTNSSIKLPSVLFIKILDFFKENYDFNSEEFFKKYSISECTLEKGFIDSSFMNILINELLFEKQDYDILYIISKFNTPKNLGLLGYLMTHSKNLYESLNMLCKYYPLIGKRIKPVLVEDENRYKIVIYFIDDEKLMDMRDNSAIIHLFAIVNLINQIIPNNIEPLYISFKQEKKYSLDKFNISNIKCDFSQEEDAIFFDKKNMSISTIASNKSLLKVYEKEAQSILDLKLDINVFKEKISGLILVSMMQLDISLESIANKADLHPRVLQKKLKKEGTSFSKILNEIRMKLAIYYINKDIDYSMISVFLAYKDSSSFFRCFKKYYKMTPSMWKLKKLEN